jgi:hypothetical protein
MWPEDIEEWMEHSATGGALSAQTAAQSERINLCLGQCVCGRPFMCDVLDSVCSIGIYLYIL